MKKLSATDYDSLLRDAVVVSADAHGPKVLRKKTGEIIKLFRLKRPWSSALVWPYALRFEQNAALLQRLGFASVEVLGAYRVEGVKRDLVLYRELAGRSLREVLQEGQPASAREALEQFASLLARLHEQGVLFRSIHFGNVLIRPGAMPALIDVADLTSRRFGGLRKTQRIRNFAHMLRYEQDCCALHAFGSARFVDLYLSHAPMRLSDRLALREKLVAMIDDSVAAHHPERMRHAQEDSRDA